jgi:hypothetical protein
MNAQKFLPKSCVPHVESKTERALTGGWGRGPGNNVSAVMCGVNAAQNQMATHMDEKFSDVFKARRAARKASKHCAGKRKVATPAVYGPSPAPKSSSATGIRLASGSVDVALAGWQTHALNRLRGKR